MRGSNRGAREQTSHEDLPKVLPPIKLHHGEAIWVLSRLGYQGKATKSTFYEYIKSLRKLGSPFERRKIGRPGGLASYSYCHMMELALVLTLRVYYFVPDSVISGIVRYRSRLHHHYRRAYSERCIGYRCPSNRESNWSLPNTFAGHVPRSANKLFRRQAGKIRSSKVAFSIRGFNDFRTAGCRRSGPTTNKPVPALGETCRDSPPCAANSTRAPPGY